MAVVSRKELESEISQDLLLPAVGCVKYCGRYIVKSSAHAQRAVAKAIVVNRVQLDLCVDGMPVNF
ncbi:hypothetical protein ACFTZB_08790 [Rhodococcus sp. NPDC057014]|uniref:hypothetical protein n=1 Tax=Rhodococcus sp. NPDC057014 TaxID=3346000 RepID=UPI00363A68CA